MARWRGALRQMRWSVELRGVSGTVALVLRRVAGRALGRRGEEDRVAEAVHPFDTENGVETSGRISGARLGAGHAHDHYNTAYLPVPPSRLRNAVAQWREVMEREASERGEGARAVGEYAFLDVGCGKGRAVMLASEMGFRECVGVELDPGLAAVARRNLERWEELGRSGCPVRVLEGDATETDLPALPLVVYLYNPFRGPVVRRLLERLEAHAGEQAGEMDVIYLVPNHRDEFARLPRWRTAWAGTVRRSEEDGRWEASDTKDAGEIWRR